MEKMTHVDEITFNKTTHLYDDFHYYIAAVIKNTTAWRSQDVITPILSNKEGDKLIIGLIKNLTDGEHIPDKYKITIEKLPKDDNQLF